jgi:hypothetical protein
MSADALEGALHDSDTPYKRIKSANTTIPRYAKPSIEVTKGSGLTATAASIKNAAAARERGTP